MNSRVRKGNKNDRQLSNNRGGYKGGRQGPSQGFSKPQSRDFSKVQETILPEFSNAYTADSVLRLVGCTVQVHTLDGHIYDGVLDAISPNFEVCLKSAHLAFNNKSTRQEYYSTPSKEEIFDISFALRNVIRIKCKNVDLDYARKDTFQTDSMISGSNGPTVTERELTRWQSDDSHALGGGLEDMGDLSNGINYDDMKRTNEMKFNFKSSFTNTSLAKYMDEIETDDPAYEMRARMAAQTAREMEKSDSHKYHDRLDSGVSEEEQFSSVKRTGLNSNSQGSNPSPGRDANMSNRGRGRSRGAQNYRGSGNEAMDSHNDGRFNRNTGNDIRRQPDQDEPPKPILYSQLFKQGISNQNPMLTANQQPQQQYQPVAMHQPNQPSQPIHQPDMHTPPSVQHGSNSRQMGSHHSQGANNQQFPLPPRMQEQKRQQQQLMANHTPRFIAAHKPHSATQRTAQMQPISPRPDQRSASFENDRDFRKNIEVPTDVASVASPEKPVPASPIEAKPAADDMAKPGPDLQKHKQDPFKDAKDIPPQKFGKILPASRPQEDNSSPKIEDLKSFSENFKLLEKHKRSKKTGETPVSQQKDSRDHEDETMVIQVSPDPPVKRDNEKVDISTENIPQMDNLGFSSEKTASETGNVAAREEKEEQTSADPVKTEPITVAAAAAEEKKPESLENSTPSQPQRLMPLAKKGLNPDAKEFRLNPNVQEFVPRFGPSSSPAPAQNVPTAEVTQYPVVTASAPSVVTPHFSNRIPQPRMRERGYQQVQPMVENQHQALYTVPHQAMQQQQHQQPQPQPQQPTQVIYLQYQTQQPQMINAMPPQAHVGHHRPLVAPIYQEGQNLIFVNPGSGQLMQQQPPQQQQQVHQIPFSHSSTPTPQSQVHHYMVQPGSQHYPQITSPLQSTPQGTMPHGMHRPLTPSQHPVLPAATPPIHHPGQQALYYNTMPIGNMQSQPAFVAAAQRGQGHMQTFQ